MNGQTSSFIALAAGVLLMLAAPLTVRLIPAQAAWTDEDQRLLQTASADYHAALHSHHHTHDSASRGGPHASHLDPEEARQAYERQQARLASVQARGLWLLWGLRLIGVALAGLGIWGYLRSRQ